VSRYRYSPGRCHGSCRTALLFVGVASLGISRDDLDME
jgi:hypothetical protein